MLAEQSNHHNTPHVSPCEHHAYAGIITFPMSALLHQNTVHPRAGACSSNLVTFSRERGQELLQRHCLYGCLMLPDVVKEYSRTRVPFSGQACISIMEIR